MADLVLIYGMKLLPADEVEAVEAAQVALKNGNSERVTMHVLSGTREQIEAQLRHSTEAFFEFYPQIS
ncbi:allantoinase [Granulicella cerasi]|uniref:Allantoinase n=1 Tax=Granulicella cerasi TaxID=741063 RepID=A0ABW1Z8Q2_9BACT|nr:allantoinase [Granulicella cerasi]